MLISITIGLFEARGHTQIFASIYLSLKKVFAIYPAVHSDDTHDSMNAWEERVAEIWFKEQLPVRKEPHLLLSSFLTTIKPSLRNTGLLIRCLVGSCSITPVLSELHCHYKPMIKCLLILTTWVMPVMLLAFKPPPRVTLYPDQTSWIHLVTCCPWRFLSYCGLWYAGTGLCSALVSSSPLSSSCFQSLHGAAVEADGIPPVWSWGAHCSLFSRND